MHFKWAKGLCNNHQEEELNWALHRAIFRCAPANKGKIALTPLLMIYMNSLELVLDCNVARRSQTVLLRIVPRVVLWITGLQLRVIYVPTFDLCRGTQWLFSVIKISVSGSKNCLESSIAWGRLKIYRWPFDSCSIFFRLLLPRLSYFFVVKENLKFRIRKYDAMRLSKNLNGV